MFLLLLDVLHVPRPGAQQGTACCRSRGRARNRARRAAGPAAGRATGRGVLQVSRPGAQQGAFFWVFSGFFPTEHIDLDTMSFKDRDWDYLAWSYDNRFRAGLKVTGEGEVLHCHAM